MMAITNDATNSAQNDAATTALSTVASAHVTNDQNGVTHEEVDTVNVAEVTTMEGVISVAIDIHHRLVDVTQAGTCRPLTSE